MSLKKSTRYGLTELKTNARGIITVITQFHLLVKFDSHQKEKEKQIAGLLKKLFIQSSSTFTVT